MRPIHPFPARMAPEAVTGWLKKLPVSSRILDPMCGSGVVLRQAALLGHDAQGFDIDPLAVLMSSVWTKKVNFNLLSGICADLVFSAKGSKNFSHNDLPWVHTCEETRRFIEFWFAEPQRSALSRLSNQIMNLYQSNEALICDCFQLALSKIIITKKTGASLAWDVSHSRPHRVRETNDFDVYDEFTKSVALLQKLLGERIPTNNATIKIGDCRKLKNVDSQSIDAVITSPPYLNAIDYMRGHKLSLVWLGYTVPHLREIRSVAIGTERAGKIDCSKESLNVIMPSYSDLPSRKQSLVAKYAADCRSFIIEMKRLLVPNGLMILVLGNSNVRGVPVLNSNIFRSIAIENNFILYEEGTREIPNNRRYLPIQPSSGSIAERMREEIIQIYRLA